MIPSERLSKLRLFSGVSTPILERLGGMMQEKTFSAGEMVIKGGEPSNALYLIGEGSVSVQTHSKVVARLETEEFFGEMSFLGNEPHSADVVANEKTTIYVLPRAAVDAVIKREPVAAIDQLTALFAAVSGRLRRTTEELVTVFDVARLIGGGGSFDQLMKSVMERIRAPLGDHTTAVFYRWNPYNDEYAITTALGPDAGSLPAVLEAQSPLVRESTLSFESFPDMEKAVRSLSPVPLKRGHLVISRSDGPKPSGEIIREGLFLYYNESPYAFDAGKRQLMESISAVMAPALASARAREEAEALERLNRSKQAGTSL